MAQALSGMAMVSEAHFIFESIVAQNPEGLSVWLLTSASNSISG
jgi:hypothetical protein